MQKILIADGTAAFRDQLQKNLSLKYQIACAWDGMQVWNLIVKLKPDLLVLDIELPGLDGITLMQRMYAAGYNPAVMVVSRMLSDYAVDTLIQMGVGYLIRKPCDPHVAAIRAEELLRHHVQISQQMIEDIFAVMRELGIPTRLHGAKYLPWAITLMANNPNQYITKELYPSVGKRFGVDGSNVERSIRNAVIKGWNSGREEIWKKYFGDESDGVPKRPNNALFIARMVEILKNKPGK